MKAPSAPGHDGLEEKMRQQPTLVYVFAGQLRFQSMGYAEDETAAPGIAIIGPTATAISPAPPPKTGRKGTRKVVS